jgi:hypothetical protein
MILRFWPRECPGYPVFEKDEYVDEDFADYRTRCHYVHKKSISMPFITFSRWGPQEQEKHETKRTVDRGSRRNTTLRGTRGEEPREQAVWSQENHWKG